MMKTILQITNPIGKRCFNYHKDWDVHVAWNFPKTRKSVMVCP